MAASLTMISPFVEIVPSPHTEVDPKDPGPPPQTPNLDTLIGPTQGSA